MICKCFLLPLYLSVIVSVGEVCQTKVTLLYVRLLYFLSVSVFKNLGYYVLNSEFLFI